MTQRLPRFRFPFVIYTRHQPFPVFFVLSHKRSKRDIFGLLNAVQGLRSPNRSIPCSRETGSQAHFLGFRCG